MIAFCDVFRVPTLVEMHHDSYSENKLGPSLPIMYFISVLIRNRWNRVHAAYEVNQSYLLLVCRQPQTALLDTFGLSQHVKEPTHTQGHTQGHTLQLVISKGVNISSVMVRDVLIISVSSLTYCSLWRFKLNKLCFCSVLRKGT